MNIWPPPPRREPPHTSTLSPLRPLLLMVLSCFSGAYLFVMVGSGPWVFPRWLAFIGGIVCLILLSFGYVLSLVLGVLIVRRTARSTAKAVVLYLLLALYALGFPQFVFMGANFASQ